MRCRALIFGLVAAGLVSLHAATVHTRSGAIHSGNLERISAAGIRLGGKTFAWNQIRRAKLVDESAAIIGLRNVSTRLLRGIYPDFPDLESLHKAPAGTARRHYLTTSTLGNNPGAILFEGDLHVPRAGAYRFHLESDDGARLFINDKPVAATPAEFSLRRTEGTVNLPPGKHALRLEYLNLASHAILNLHWSGPGLNQAPLSFQLTTGSRAPPPEAVISTGGALAWDGSFIAYPVYSLNSSRVRFAGEPEGIRLSTLNAAAVIFEPISLPQAARFQGGRTGRKGVLLQNGDFFEGEIQSVTNSIVTVKSLLHGAKNFRAGSEVVAAFLQKPAAPQDRWTLRTTTGHTLKLRELKWEKDVIITRRAPFPGLRVKAGDITEIAFGIDPDPVQAAWAKWTTMDATARKAARARQGDFANRFRGRASAWAERARFEQQLEDFSKQISLAEKTEATALQVLAKAEADVRAGHVGQVVAMTVHTEALIRRDMAVHQFNGGNTMLGNANAQAVNATNLFKTLTTQNRLASEAEAKELAAMKTRLAKQIADAEKVVAAAKAAFDKARQAFKGDLGPVEKTAAAEAARRARDLAEARRATAQRQADEARAMRDAARNELNTANNALTTAKRNLDSQKGVHTRAQAAEAKILSSQKEPAALRLKQAREALAKAESAYAEANEQVIQLTQPRNDAKAILTSKDDHVRNMETNRRQMQSRLRQVEDIDRRAQSATTRAKATLDAARATLDRIISQSEKPALKQKRDVDVRLVKLATQAKTKSDDKTLAAQLKQLENEATAAEQRLNQARQNLDKPTDAYRKAISAFDLTVVKSNYTRDQVDKRKADLAMQEKQLAQKKLEAAAARKRAEELARLHNERTAALNRAKQAVVQARANLNRYNAEANRANSAHGNARNTTLQAASRLAQLQPPHITAMGSVQEKTKLLADREKELARRTAILQQATATKAAAEKRVQTADAAKRALPKPLDGAQQNLAGLRNAHLQAVAVLENLRADSTRELALFVARTGISENTRSQKLQFAKAAALKTGAELAKAKASVASAEKAKLAGEQSVKLAEADIVARQKLQAERLKALSTAGTALRTVSGSLWSLHRQHSDADYSLARHRLTHRALLARP